MTKLASLQTAFEQYLFDGNESISSYIVSTEKFHSKDRLAIYANAYQARLVETLANDYPALNCLLGDDGFRNMSAAYIQANPSCYYSLRWFGKKLPQFLWCHNDYRERPYLAELADFEWAFINAFDAVNSKVLGIDDAAEIPPECWPNLQLTLHPSVQQVACLWNCLAVWQAMKSESGLVDPQLMDNEVNYLIWRQGLNTNYRSLAPDEAGALRVVGQEGNFAELCELLAGWMPTDKTALRAATLFKTWLAGGLVSQIIY